MSMSVQQPIVAIAGRVASDSAAGGPIQASLGRPAARLRVLQHELAAVCESDAERRTIPLATFFQDISYVTLKVTNGCNLQCTYCNVEADSPATPRMSLEVFRKIARALIENSRASRVGLEFHGGEPLLLSDDWYREAVSFAGRLARRHGKRVDHPLQTNATMLSEKRLDTMLGLGIQIGFSIDGPPEINDQFRQGGRAVERAIARLHARDKGFGVILVLSHANYARMGEVMDYFQSVGIRDFRVNFLQPQGRGMEHQLLTGEQMFEGMLSVLDHMIENDGAVVEADMELAIQRFLKRRSSKPRLSCWEHECQAGRTYVAVDWQGGVYACGTDMSQHRLGQIARDLDAVHVEKALRTLHEKGSWFDRCVGCEAKPVCNQSCPTSDHNDLAYREAECRYTKLMFRHLVENDEAVRRVHRTQHRGCGCIKTNS